MFSELPALSSLGFFTGELDAVAKLLHFAWSSVLGRFRGRAEAHVDVNAIAGVSVEDVPELGWVEG